jgi:hypothetical protein
MGVQVFAGGMKNEFQDANLPYSPSSERKEYLATTSVSRQ